jgi:hypothetical protein
MESRVFEDHTHPSDFRLVDQMSRMVSAN